MTDASENRASDAGGKVGVVIVAAGRGARAGQADGPKQYQRIGDRAVIAHTLEKFLSHPSVGPVIVAIHADDRELFDRAAGADAERVRAITGGLSRQASVRLGLLALREQAPAKVLVHDAVRPFVDAALIDRTIEAIGQRQGALPALPVADTLKRESATGMIEATVSRTGLHAAQTPQGFPFWPLLAAHEKAHHLGKTDFTDDAAIAEWAHIPVKIVTGSPDNVKLTWARDIAMADQRLSSALPRFPDIRTGNGYDVHAFEPGDHVTLCGVAIPYDRKLSGHSDADVGLHALTDALLATCGAGDIGTHFPPSDPQWKGVASKIFVEHAAKLVRERGGRIANADITLICEAPRVGPHRAAMTAALAAMLGIAPERISIKATTNEKLGFVGRGEGIAAIATASVAYPGDVPA
ncbi:MULTISPECIES: bifunctional 2-C-methyl-D-erythritol 4-phosphate cytidylyltransferase/2-C-methyl-D-erythritol 2,4-cyclodiphosphate synthase [unclassified Mesorhizobium]|uniref:bifunctional 2-C-methyl-D-erythritol 4-phosphate cytidylyltransferase/2-C-methyl-D-erythritol 2,4-cyclodiphosphate synthase n=2 Tax=Mesorhizobium TaxID=68287 RepID=UPI000FCC0BEF|nr:MULTISPECIES: bifunctional 2-C-methyl-D-erythritol 4-phosphate cytidylyltransferase/2-C-methyl-D-erythritol 2,4-cyclodiphosphate synthase [unclassified Mesorhizobium]TGP26766.1 bifunctional 2-C-methyl-D-erythritol 4-phosphate cytidylyltransferase/2-C-methyl-D-erythritol 2,4-cyclodiphosphate synthase [Mesorhizobium sp. M1D.F.Ca.ET.231.01.1.1]TGP38723.1 bifunctional 2-C-methyl-D-erythritol 4-phosphate cytidylyltransferase/2-C-methyl-D-erythritol 2,4-cyclodiphosphate synthase [Mesorhizobium sp. M